MIETFIICLILSIDLSIISFSYGISKIKIPLTSIIGIVFINFLISGLGILFSYLFTKIVAEIYFTYASIILIFLIGLISFVKEIKHKNNYFEICQDKNNDKILSLKESIFLGFALSIDSFCVGLSLKHSFTIIFSYFCFILLFSFSSILIFSKIGYKISKKPLNLSWLSGICLIIFSLVKFFLTLFS